MLRPRLFAAQGTSAGPPDHVTAHSHAALSRTRKVPPCPGTPPAASRAIPMPAALVSQPREAPCCTLATAAQRALGAQPACSPLVTAAGQEAAQPGPCIAGDSA